MSPARRHVYGPVPSRRLGRSLGVDLVPFKTCSYDCVYCQLGRTTNKTLDRKAYVPVGELLDEVADRLRSGPAPDYIGLAGSGEPTLHAGLRELIAGVKRLTGVPVAVLTNGSLLWLPEVREALAQADVVLPSLDAGGQATFERVNRPHPAISFERMVDGLAAFREGYQGQIWLEVFVLRGISDGPDEAARVAAAARRARPDRVQLNTVSRPPAEDFAAAVDLAHLERLRPLFGLGCEVVAERAAPPPSTFAGRGGDEGELLSFLRRRPCTVDGLAAGLGLAPNEIVKHLEALAAAGLVRWKRRDGATWAVAANRPDDEKEELP